MAVNMAGILDTIPDAQNGAWWSLRMYYVSNTKNLVMGNYTLMVQNQENGEDYSISFLSITAHFHVEF